MILGFDLKVHKNDKSTGKSRVAKLTFVILNLHFICFTIFSAFRTLLADHVSFPALMNSMLLNALLVIVRITLISKRQKILQVIESMSGFIDINSMAYQSRRRYILATLLFCILINVCAWIYPMVEKSMGHGDYHMVSRVLLPIFDIPRAYEKMCVILFSLSHMLSTNVCFCIYCVILSFLYFSFNESILEHFGARLRKLKKSATSARICKCVMIATRIRSLHQMVESAASMIAFTIFSLQFTHSLYYVYRYSRGFGGESYNTISFLFIALSVIWFVILSLLGSRVESLQQEHIRLIHDVIGISCISRSIPSVEDRLNLDALLNITKQEMKFTCWGVFAFDKNLVLNAVGVLVTYSVLFVP